MAVSAVWVPALRQCVVTFNMPLQSVALELANWKLSYSGGEKQPSGSSIAANVVTLFFDASPGVTQIAYDPPPFDVRAVPPNGLPAAAFSLPL